MSVNTPFWLDDSAPCIILQPAQTPDKTTSYLASSYFFFCMWTLRIFFFFKSWLIRKDSNKKLPISSRVQLYLELNVFSRWDGERSSMPRLYKPPRLWRSSCKWSNTSEIATAWRHTQCLPSQFLSSSMRPLYEILTGNLRLILSSFCGSTQ